VLGFDAGTIIALGAMLISALGALFKFIDRRRQLKKDKAAIDKKLAVADVERDSIVIRGAEGALLLMERTLKTANEECERRINELEEELSDLKCENTALKQELRDVRIENSEFRKQLHELNDRLRRIE